MQFSRCFITPQQALHVSDVEGIHHQELNMYRAGRQVQCACDSWIVVWCSALRISSGLACGGYGSAVHNELLMMDAFDIRNMQSLQRCNKTSAELHHAGFIYYNLLSLSEFEPGTVKRMAQSLDELQTRMFFFSLTFLHQNPVFTLQNVTKYNLSKNQNFLRIFLFVMKFQK